ncbi:MAG: preprotein translocase subunit SecE [Erysipelotrichaceae bacterium]|nr:preprotein translocase subunit SecE [Erysipelotrichaceae bacterium]
MSTFKEISKIHWPKPKTVLALARTTIAVIAVYALLFTVVQVGVNALF